LQLQAAHWQLLLLQVCVPLPSQLCVLFDAHAPWPPHADHADHDPSPLHVRVSLPQLPQGPDALPLHGQTPAWQVTPLAQACAHAPQFALSVCSATHVLPQSV
jgi:hypothetical protein